VSLHELTTGDRARGGRVTTARYGIEDLRCPLDGTLCAKRSCFHTENGRKGGLKGMRTFQARFSREQRVAWAKLGGRPRNGN